MKFVFAIVLFFISALSLLAQRSYIIDVNNGLTTNNLTDLFLDHQDNLWIASYHGLMKHEGGRIKHFDKVGKNADNISSLEMHSVIEDKCGNIWFATTGGVDMLNPNTNIIEHIYLKSPYNGSTFIGYIYWICQDDEEFIWVSTDIGAFKIDNVSHFVEKISESKDEHGMPHQYLNYTGGVSTTKGLWMSTNGGLTYYEYATKTFYHNYHNPDDKLAFCFAKKDKSLKSDLRMDDAGKLWFVHDGSYLASYDVKTDKIDTFKMTFPLGTWSCCKSLAIDKYNNVWIGTRHGGIFVFDQKQKAFTHYMYKGINSLIPSNYIHSIEADKYGYVYVSTNNGLAIIDYYNHSIRERILSDDPRFLDLRFESGDISYDEVRQLVYIPFYNYGYIEYNIKRDSFASHELTQFKKGTPLLMAEEGKMMIAYKNNMFGFNAAKNEINERDKRLSPKLDSIKGDIISYTKIKENEYILKKNKGQIIHLQGDSMYIFKGSGFKPNMNFSKNGKDIWYISKDVNLMLYQVQSHKTIKYDLQDHLSKSNFNFSNPRHLCDDGSNIWITGQTGVLKYDYHKDKLETYSVVEGLSHGFTFSVAADQNNDIWVASLGGIDKYDKKSNRFVNIVPIHDIGYMAAFGHVLLTKDGKLIFHLGNKLYILDPNTTSLIEPQSLLSFSEISVNGKYYYQNDRKLSELSSKENNISLSYSLRDFINPERVNYSYRINNGRWVDNSNNTSIHLTSLNHGDYSIQIQAINSKGIASNTILTNFSILAPYYQRPWFYALTSLVLAALIYFYYKNKIRDIELKNQIAIQMAELKSKALRAQMNPHFLFNSLNTIQECIVTEKVEMAYDYLSIFSKFLRKVLNYSESNFITFSEELDLMDLYIKIESLRFTHKVSLTTHVDDSIDLDAELIPPMLLQPFIENAIRHGLRTREEGKAIWINLSSNADDIKIDIIDNGIGIRQAELSKRHSNFSHDYESKGIEISTQRLKGLCQNYQEVKIENAFVDETYPGTRVHISIPKIYENQPKA